MSDGKSKHRGRDGGRRRCVVAVSMPEYDLVSLDEMAERIGRWRGRKIGRSEMLRILIAAGRRVMNGQPVHNL